MFKSFHRHFLKPQKYNYEKATRICLTDARTKARDRQKGGLKVSQNKDHMSRIGRLGGMKSKPPKKD